MEVVNEKIAFGLWKKLESLYMKKFLTNRLYLKQRLYNPKMKEGMPLCDHLGDFNRIILNLKNINIRVDGEDRALILLSYYLISFIISLIKCCT